MKRLLLRLLAFTGFALLFLPSVSAQDHLSVARAFIREKASELGLSQRQAAEPVVSSSHESKEIGVTHFYFQQHFEGIPVNAAILNVHITKENKVLTHGSTFVPDIESKINTTRPAITSRQALEFLIAEMGYEREPLLQKEAKQGPTQEVIFDKGKISLEDIPVRLAYQPMEDGSVLLAWDITIDEPGGQNYWSIRVDAVTGKILEKDNLVVHCNFGDAPHTHRAGAGPFHAEQLMMESAAPPVVDGAAYRVFSEPWESPVHGPRSLVVNPADPIASPFGWHDTNGAPGPEFTITRGNNVHAGLDLAAPNGIDAGTEPDGGPGLVFDFPLDLSLAPDTYRPAAVTNLFYWNNLIHDFSYKYGFDEASGNFQVNNYGRGGAGNDDVRAEGQDYSGTNNANFATPVDGSRPRMQMYIWNQGVSSVTVNSPLPAATYIPGNAGFGPTDFTLNGDLELANPLEGCGPLVGFTPGKIAVIDRGTCPFVDKVLNAQNSGAIAVIICNNVAGDPITMGGASAGITIPSLMLSQDACNMIKFQMSYSTVNVTMTRVLTQYDSDFDNGIIAHEYAHGISNRLTGGRTVVNCLNNNEQMGEGWSDWYGLMMTIRPGDQGADVRGIGTYVLGQSTTGNGIRPTPYSTDMSINPSTYNTTKTAAVPHGVGYVWCSMLWDLTWAMIEDHGFATGFDVAMWLVNDGMKMQPCRPGFVDGRNAILAADQARYGGANQCRIWQVFARRGLGFSASQGANTSATDGTEAYDLPSIYDADGDGYYVCIDDCNDNDNTVYPGAPEICDGKDNNCNGSIDETGPPPAPWTSANVGVARGSNSYNPCPASNPTFTLSAKGNSAPNAETEHFVYSTICGTNASITVRVANLSGGGWAGITMRESTAPGSRMVALKTQLTTNVIREVRSVANGPKQTQQFPANMSQGWMRITRSGSTFQFFISPNGSSWQLVATANATLGNCLMVGMFSESINVNTTTTAVFSNVTVTGGGMLMGPANGELVQEGMSSPDFSVFPNPTGGELSIDLSAYFGRQVRIELYSLEGRLLRFSEVDEVQTTMEILDLSKHSDGMYMLRVKSEGLPDVTKRIVLTQ